MKVNGFIMNFSKHAKSRLRERGISLEHIHYILEQKYKDFRNYRFLGKELCYKSGGISLIFNVSGRYINIITVMDFNAKVKDAIII